jgi:hypothetical protein
VEKLQKFLQKMLPDKRIGFYHGALEDRERASVQLSFVKGELDVLVATSASFGLGVNMILVSKVVCVGVPMSVQAVSQMIGRGGRRGQEYYCDFYVKEGDLVKSRIMLDKESATVTYKYRKYMLDSFEAVHFLISNSYADKSLCLLNIILLGVDAGTTLLSVPYSDLQNFKKQNSTVRACNRAKWNGAVKKWFLPPFAVNAAVAHWNRSAVKTVELLDAPRCQKCSNCRNFSK